MTFDTAGATFDTLLAVYTGEELEALAGVAGNDDYGSAKSGRLTFLPVAGATYFIAVDGKSFDDDPSMGNLVLNWHPTPPPVFRRPSGFEPTGGEWGTRVGLYGTNFTGVTGVLFNGVAAAFTNWSDLRIAATLPVGAESGPITVQTPHGSVTSTNIFTAQSKVIYSASGTQAALWVDWAGNGFVLEFTESLAQPVWQPAPQTPTFVEGGNRQVLVLPFEGSAVFYRWRRD